MISFSTNDLFLITGASSGIGKAITLLLNTMGARVIALARDQSRLMSLQIEAKYPDNIYPIKLDLIKEKHNLKQLILEWVLKYGKIRGLVHAAGINKLMPLKMLTSDDYETLQAINVTMACLLLQACADRRCCTSPASVVLLSSISAHLGYPGLIAYSATKGAIEALTRSAAVELAGKKIRVNCIAAGHVDTPLSQQMLANSLGDTMQEDLKRYPLGVGTAQNVADLAVFLLSDRAAWLTGQRIILDGGRTLV